jgi:hypothetical protein
LKPPGSQAEVVLVNYPRSVKYRAAREKRFLINDHTGRLPLLAKGGNAAPVFATSATIEMTALILRNSARIQAGDVERRNRKRERAGEPPVEPLYTPEHAETVIRRVDHGRRRHV